MSEIIFSVSGVRGIYGDSLTLPVVVHYTLAFAKFCRDKKKSRKIIVGRDGRLMGDEVAAVAIYTLSIAGFEVIDIGVVPTPDSTACSGKIKGSRRYCNNSFAQSSTVERT